MPATNFTYDGVHVFLTYPQCTLEREQLRDFFVGLAPNCKFFIARELHDDGAPHLHAYVHFGGRRRFCAADCFDVEGFHPNIQRPRSAKHVVEYCGKEDREPLANFTPGSEPSGGWGDILEGCDTREQFLERVRQRFPRDYCLALERLLFFCEWRFGRVDDVYSGRGRHEFVEPPTLTDWVQSNLTTVRNLSSHPHWLFLFCCAGGGPQSPPPLPFGQS